MRYDVYIFLINKFLKKILGQLAIDCFYKGKSFDKTLINRKKNYFDPGRINS